MEKIHLDVSFLRFLNGVINVYMSTTGGPYLKLIVITEETTVGYSALWSRPGVISG